MNEGSVSLHLVIREAREGAGISLTAAAQRLGVGKATLSRLETGKGPITATRLEQLASVYGVSPGALLDRTVVKLPGQIDYEQLGMVVEEVERTIQKLDVRPRPEKVRTAVVEVLKLAQTDVTENPGAVFDPRRYLGMVEAMFKE